MKHGNNVACCNLISFFHFRGNGRRLPFIFVMIIVSTSSSISIKVLFSYHYKMILLM